MPSRTRRRRRNSDRRRRLRCRAARIQDRACPRLRFSSTSAVVRERCLRVLVQTLHVRVRRRAVQIEVTLLDVLAVVALRAGQAEQALFEERVAVVPEREPEADVLMAIADAGEAVLVPAVDTRSGVIVRKEFPGVAVRAVVFADRRPGTVAEIWSPAFPMSAAVGGFLQSSCLSLHRIRPRPRHPRPRRRHRSPRPRRRRTRTTLRHPTGPA